MPAASFNAMPLSARTVSMPRPAIVRRQASMGELITHLRAAHHGPLREAAAPLARHMERMAAEVPAQAEAARMLCEHLGTLTLHLDKLEQVIYPLLSRLERGEPGAYLLERLIGPDALALEADLAQIEEGLSTLRMIARRCPHEGTAETMRQLVEHIRRFARLEAEVLLPRARELAAG